MTEETAGQYRKDWNFNANSGKLELVTEEGNLIKIALSPEQVVQFGNDLITGLLGECPQKPE